MKIKKSFFKSPVFWIIQFVLFFASLFYTIHFYPKAFPIVNLQIKMNRETALTAAKELALKHHWGPNGFQQAVEFDTDQKAQTFIELAGGGKEAFARVIQQKLFVPYSWVVRHFQQYQIEETLISFTPEGEFNGFIQNLPESLPGPALTSAEALKLAETHATQDWQLNLSNYRLIEKSQNTQPSKRIDHSFVYERNHESVGEGKFRLKLMVSGDRLTGIQYYVQIPAAFSRKYGEMRSANDTIAAIASAAMLVLYIFGGCFFGAFYLARKKWLSWKEPLIAAAVVAGFQVADKINQLPLSWTKYDTAISKQAFVLKYLVSSGSLFLTEFLLLSLSFMAAESLSRLAFPHHPQLWKSWKPKNASSPEILGRTVGGYFSVGFFFAFVVSIYLFGSRLFGWWSPSDLLFQPDALASYLPWFTSISQSLHAGFWEEALFRAVPLAGAALLGQHFGRRKLGITIGMIIQALIFAGAHANYPAQPSYARVVELIIPSLIFGGLYLNFGLLPGILLHFTFDTVSFAIPLFASSGPGVWKDQLLVVVFLFVPLWIVLYGRLRSGSWKQLTTDAYNSSWAPIKATLSVKRESQTRHVFVAKPGLIRLVWVLGIAGAIAWFGFFEFKNDTWNLNVTRSQAIEAAKAYLEKRGTHLNSEWEPLATLNPGISSGGEFVWKTSGADTFHQLVGRYLLPPSWTVRFVRFHVDVAERAEQYQVYLGRDQQVLYFRHELPEARPLPTIDEEEARRKSLDFIQQNYGLNPSQIKEVSKSGITLPNRKDWTFTFTDPGVQLKEGDVRLLVYLAGNSVTGSSRYVFIPEDWIRQEKNDKTLMRIVGTICGLILGLFLFGALIYSVIRWTQRKFNISVFKKTFLLLLGIGVALFINELPIPLSQLSTIEPKSNQLLSLILFWTIRVLLQAFIPAIILGYLDHSFHSSIVRHPHSRKQFFQDIATGLSIGMIYRVCLTTIERSFPKELPTIPRFGALERWIPAFSGLELVEQFFWFSLFLLIVYQTLNYLTVNGTKRLWLSFLFLVTLSVAVNGVDADSLFRWLSSGIVGGILLFVSYCWLIRDHHRLIPLIIGGVFILAQSRQPKMQPYPYVTLYSLISILMVGVVAVFWYKHLYGNPKGSGYRPEVGSV